MIINDIKFYDLKELATTLKVTQRTIMNYLKEGRIEGIKIGGKWQISQDNLNKFLSGKY